MLTIVIILIVHRTNVNLPGKVSEALEHRVLLLLGESRELVVGHVGQLEGAQVAELVGREGLLKGEWENER